MGKCGVRSCGEQRKRSPSSSSTAAGYLTLRSGRRVPAVAAAACSPTRSRRQQCRVGAKSAQGSPRRKQSAAAGGVRRQCCRVVASHLVVPGGQPEQEAPAPGKASDPIVRDGRCDVGDSRRDTLLMSDEAEALKKHHQCEANRGVAADRPARSPPPPEAEMEAFFAAAELTEHRRFAETYNYDVALDRPLDGRFEWAPVST